MSHYITPKIKELTLYFSPIKGALFFIIKTEHYHPYIFERCYLPRRFSYDCITKLQFTNTMFSWPENMGSCEVRGLVKYQIYSEKKKKNSQKKIKKKK